MKLRDRMSLAGAAVVVLATCATAADTLSLSGMVVSGRVLPLAGRQRPIDGGHDGHARPGQRQHAPTHHHARQRERIGRRRACCQHNDGRAGQAHPITQLHLRTAT